MTTQPTIEQPEQAPYRDLATAGEQPMFSELLAGGRKLRVVWAFAISAIVTGAVVTPLALRVDGATPVEAVGVAAAPDCVVANTSLDGTQPLEGQTLSGRAIISYRCDGVAVAFSVYDDGDSDEPIVTRMDTEGPSFDLFSDDLGRANALDTTKLDDGTYQIFVTATQDNAEPQQVSTSFEVDNGAGS